MSKKKNPGTKQVPASKQPSATTTVRWVLVVGIVAAALLGAYLFASASQRGGGSHRPGAQQVSVAVTTVYTPSTIELKAGVPADITFSRGQGCASIVKSQSLGFQEDLSSGPRTVQLGALQPGTYDFECGMNMVRGQIIVR